MGMKSLVRRAIASEAVRPLLASRVHRARATVLMYHELGDDADRIDAWTIVRRSDFLAQVGHLRRHYDIVSIDEALQSSGRAGARPLAVLTFDDGDANNHEILLPLVESERIPVTLYIATGHIRSRQGYWFDRVVNAAQGDRPVDVDLGSYGLGAYTLRRSAGAGHWAEIQRLLEAIKTIEPARRDEVVERAIAQLSPGLRAGLDPIRPLSIDQVRALGRHPLVTIGAHSDCHNLLTQLPLDEARRSMALSAQLLREWSGQAVRHFAYPNGSHDAAVAAAARELGFVTATSTRPGLWRAHTDPMRIPRIGVGRYDDLATFRFNLLGLRDDEVRVPAASLERQAA